jgi:hypothetical protein
MEEIIKALEAARNELRQPHTSQRASETDLIDRICRLQNTVSLAQIRDLLEEAVRRGRPDTNG